MKVAMDRFLVSVAADGAFLPAGELDGVTIEVLRALVDPVMVPGRAIVLDLASLTFLDSNVIRWLVEVFDTTGSPVVLRNCPPTFRLILEIAATVGPDGAWVYAN